MIALILGVASLACSSAIWVALALRHVSNINAWDVSAGRSLVFWAAAALLAAVAARIGSRKWLFAALFPVLNVVIFVALVHLSRAKL